MRVALVLVLALVACGRGKRATPARDATSPRETMKMQGLPCDDGTPRDASVTGMASEPGRGLEGSDAQFRRVPCPDAGTP